MLSQHCCPGLAADWLLGSFLRLITGLGWTQVLSLMQDHGPICVCALFPWLKAAQFVLGLDSEEENQLQQLAARRIR